MFVCQTQVQHKMRKQLSLADRLDTALSDSNEHYVYSSKLSSLMCTRSFLFTILRFKNALSTFTLETGESNDLVQGFSNRFPRNTKVPRGAPQFRGSLPDRISRNPA